MATRFYLPSSGAAAVSPTLSTQWEDTSIGTSPLRCVTTKTNSAMTTRSFADANATLRDIFFQQYVSDPIEAQTIANQTIKWQILAKERAASCNMALCLVIRVFDITGQTVRTGGLSVSRAATEFDATTLTNRALSDTFVNVTALDGDRIVIEIGAFGDPGGGSDHDSDLRIGDADATDLPEDETATTDNNPWIEFPNTLTFWIPNKWSSVYPAPYPDKRLVSPY